MDYIFNVHQGYFSNGKKAVVDDGFGGEEQLMDGWYFWDETQEEHGPFNTAEEAKAALKEYADTL